jgi:CubicO group peptidase (beta-lactamase class C family)
LNDTATCFAAQSLSKVLFAYLVMQLVDKGVIDLDKPLHTYLPKPLPEYDNYRDLASDDRWKLLTARMCLDHTTGFPNWRQLNPHRNGKLEIFYDPGKHYAYSGEGIELLQMVIETITGRSLEDLAREDIFQPFGMSRSSYFWQPEFANDFALGHNALGDTLRRRRQNSANAAGSLETTIADYSRFMAAVLRKERVSSATWNQMITPQIAIDSKSQFPSLNTSHTKANKSIQLSYGLGWGLFYTKAGWAFFKEGHNDGWQHYTIAFQESKDAYLFLTNSDNGESIFKELVGKITGVTIPWRWEGYTD